MALRGEGDSDQQVHVVTYGSIVVLTIAQLEERETVIG